MGQILGSYSHVSIASMVRVLLTVVMEIWDPDCGPLWPNFAVCAVLGQLRNTISPRVKGRT